MSSLGSKTTFLPGFAQLLPLGKSNLMRLLGSTVFYSIGEITLLVVIFTECFSPFFFLKSTLVILQMKFKIIINYNKAHMYYKPLKL